MRVVYHKRFEKAYAKLRRADQERFHERLRTFMHDPFDQALNNHPLHGTYAGYRSINVRGDLRAIYKETAPDIAVFVTIGTHHELYAQ